MDGRNHGWRMIVEPYTVHLRVELTPKCSSVVTVVLRVQVYMLNEWTACR